MDLLRSLIVPRENMDLPSLAELERQQEETMAMLAQPEEAPSRARIEPLVTRFAPAEETSTAPTSKAYQTLTLEEYTAQAQAQEAELLKTNPEAFDRNGKFVVKKQTQKQQPLRPISTNKGAVQPVAIEPVALGKPRTSDNTIALHHLVQKHNIPLPKFTWSENGTKGAGTFSVKIEIFIHFPPTAGPVQAGKVCHAIEWADAGPYRSKKEAKEGISEQALKVVQDEVDKIEKAQQEAADAMAASTPDVVMPEQAPAPAVKAVREPHVSKENAIGLLLEFCSAKSLPQPQYQLYSLGIQSFACELTVQHPSPVPDQEQEQAQEAASTDSTSTLTLNETPNQPTDEHPTLRNSDSSTELTEPSPLTTQLFGSKTQAHPSKKTAKMSAARSAIAHLRSISLLAAPGAPPPRKRERVSSRSTADEGPDTKALRIDDAEGADGSATPSLVSDHGSSANTSFTSTSPEDAKAPTSYNADHTDKSQPSYVSRAHHLREALGLGNLEYRLVNTPGTAFYKGAAYFPHEKNAGFRSVLQGPVGRLEEEMFGKKAAKEEIARAVVKVLEGERARRGVRIGGK